MRVSVVVCGANGERSIILERSIEEFAKKYSDRIIQFSACTVAVSPIIIEMSGGEQEHTVAVNGCRNRCSDLMKKAVIVPTDLFCSMMQFTASLERVKDAPSSFSRRNQRGGMERIRLDIREGGRGGPLSEPPYHRGPVRWNCALYACNMKLALIRSSTDELYKEHWDPAVPGRN